MAKKSIVERENKRNGLYKKYLKTKTELKKIIKEGTPEEAWAARLKLQKVPRNAHLTRKRNRCQLTGRPRGYVGKFGLSRSMLRILACAGEIPGIRKASW